MSSITTAILQYACDIEKTADALELDTFVSVSERLRNEIFATDLRKMAKELRDIIKDNV